MNVQSGEGPPGLDCSCSEWSSEELRVDDCRVRVVKGLEMSWCRALVKGLATLRDSHFSTLGTGLGYGQMQTVLRDQGSFHWNMRMSASRQDGLLRKAS